MKSFNLTRRDFLKSTAGVGAFLGCQISSKGESSDSSEKPLCSIGLIADAQYVDAEPRGSRYYRNSVEKLNDAVKTLSHNQPEFYVHLGDLIDRELKSFQDILQPYESITRPVYQLLGNHDWEVAETDKPQVPSKLGLDKNRYYSRSTQGFRWIFLDGTDISLYAHTKGSEKHSQAVEMLNAVKERHAKNAMTWNGGIGPEQMVWLNQETEAARQAGEKVILCCHFPVYPVDPHNLWNDLEILSWIDQNEDVVVAWFNGHNHAGAYAERNGIHYLTLNGMVETAATNAFALVDLYSDQIRINGYGRVQSRILKFKDQE